MMPSIRQPGLQTLPQPQIEPGQQRRSFEGTPWLPQVLPLAWQIAQAGELTVSSSAEER